MKMFIFVLVLLSIAAVPYPPPYPSPEPTNPPIPTVSPTSAPTYTPIGGSGEIQVTPGQTTVIEVVTFRASPHRPVSLWFILLLIFIVFVVWTSGLLFINTRHK